MTITRIQFSMLFLVICISVTYGKRPRKIINGEKVRNAPYQVLIQDSYSSIHCGGAIIDARHVLTAAHCLVDGSGGSLLSSLGRIIIIGLIDIRDIPDENVYYILNVRIHEGYNAGNSYHNDIAVARVYGDIEFTKNQKPIPLPVSDTIEGTLVMATGWGVIKYNYSTHDAGPYSDILQKSLEQVISQKQCQEVMTDDFIHPEQICAWSAGRTTACYGDSGGPLIDSTSIVGIISFSEFCNPLYPTVYTRVYKYVEWIKNVTKFL